MKIPTDLLVDLLVALALLVLVVVAVAVFETPDGVAKGTMIIRNATH